MKKLLLLSVITCSIANVYCSKQEQPISSYPLAEGINTRLYSQCPCIIEHINASRYATPLPFIEAFKDDTDRFCKEHLDEVTFFDNNGKQITTLEWISKSGTTFARAKSDSDSWKKWDRWPTSEGYPIKVHLERNNAIVYEKTLPPKHDVVTEFIKQCFGKASPVEKKIAIIVGTHNCDDQNIKEALEKYFEEQPQSK